jgi:hypothetical protein
VLVLRGTESDVLLRSTAEEMQTRGPPTEIIEFEGIGHAPRLTSREQVRIVCDWLRD